MTAVVVVLDRDSKPWRLAYFKSEAKRVARQLDADGPYPLHTGRELVELAERYDRHSVDHLVVCAHGGPDWLLHPRTGVHNAPRFPQLGQVGIDDIAAAWSARMTREVLVSLCACLCSRSPTWWLRRYRGSFKALWASTWGKRSYLPGGESSLSARFRDWLVLDDHLPDVRGHRSAGDLLGNPLLSKHTFPAAGKSEPLVSLALPNEPITLGLRRWWCRKPRKGEELAEKVVIGRLAERWLLGDDSVEGQIGELWAQR